ADYVVWLYAIPRAGMRALLLNVRDHPRGWADIIRRSGCALVAGDRRLLDLLAPECPGHVTLLSFDAIEPAHLAATVGVEASGASESVRRELAAPPEAAQWRTTSEAEPSEVAWIVPTSGTTGTPKLARLTH